MFLGYFAIPVGSGLVPRFAIFAKCVPKVTGGIRKDVDGRLACLSLSPGPVDE